MKYGKKFADLSDLELFEKEKDLKQELFNLRFKHAIKQLENTSQLTAVKKQIAVVKTIRRQREISATGTN